MTWIQSLPQWFRKGLEIARDVLPSDLSKCSIKLELFADGWAGWASSVPLQDPDDPIQSQSGPGDARWKFG
jgi:hypothetical protein